MGKLTTIGTAALMSAVILLAGCGKDESKETAGAPASGAQSVEQVAAEMRKVSLQPGEWETTSEVTDVTIDNAPQGMPSTMMDAMKGRKTIVKHCITPEQAKRPDAGFMAGQQNSKCSYSGFQMAGGAVQGTVSCPGPQGGMATVQLKGIYTPTSYTMTMAMDGAGMGGAPGAAGGKTTMHMKMKSSAKRIGDCPKG